MAWIIILNYNDKSAIVVEVPENLQDTQEYLENNHGFAESSMHYMEFNIDKLIEFVPMPKEQKTA